MDFDLTEDQKQIKDVARELLSARSPMSKVREAAEAGVYDPALWREIVALGWAGIAVEERYGGQGLGAVELAVLLGGAWLRVRGDSVSGDGAGGRGDSGGRKR